MNYIPKSQKEHIHTKLNKNSKLRFGLDPWASSSKLFNIVIFMNNKESFKFEAQCARLQTRNFFYIFIHFHYSYIILLMKMKENYWKYIKIKDTKKSLKEKCLTRTYTKTNHMTWTLYIKIWAICLYNLYKKYICSSCHMTCFCI